MNKNKYFEKTFICNYYPFVFSLRLPVQRKLIFFIDHAQWNSLTKSQQEIEFTYLYEKAINVSGRMLNSSLNIMKTSALQVLEKLC